MERSDFIAYIESHGFVKIDTEEWQNETYYIEIQNECFLTAFICEPNH